LINLINVGLVLSLLQFLRKSALSSAFAELLTISLDLFRCIKEEGSELAYSEESFHHLLSVLVAEVFDHCSLALSKFGLLF
jgi:hypothetical protein